MITAEKAKRLSKKSKFDILRPWQCNEIDKLIKKAAKAGDHEVEIWEDFNEEDEKDVRGYYTKLGFYVSKKTFCGDPIYTILWKD